MFFASAPSAFQSAVRRPAYAHAGRSVERFLDDAMFGARQNAYTQDETAFTLTLDMPGIAKEQLSIAIDGAVVRIQSKEDAPRRYRAAYELPQDVDSALSEAKLENGVLTLKLAKKVPVNNATELTIQ
ncbi:Hsp20/alpha crystallin family protein [Rhodoferax sp. TS-BS-61-7]|uniref:Hsp20/alpha crystallin family protein n=1 Tax=Rhodoferax sp. TS-BS-61-7 TaxID=2094194 RepID=UPI000CF673BE|nr:Hsp20/alpha crystallin family protein [Rhodoferax sp. TS-BS-61-7]PQA76419.1 heat-shock protein Hsp20 [Rhodoferax sp. TS-BS-61-7]